ncbi:MAG: hypothetical protein LBR24_00525 [Methanobrevibacter sp.]|nr:hypothetical protein [Methanobrevibacter sp.]
MALIKVGKTNINKKLVRYHLAEIVTKYRTEFNPYSWL